MSICIAQALNAKGMEPTASTAIVQGFGNVGSVTAEILHSEMGVKVVGVSDHTAAYYDPRGLPIPEMVLYSAEHGGLEGWSSELKVDPVAMLALPCDILAPCAVERVIDASVAEKLQRRILAEGANGPTTPDADRVLDQRRDEVFLIPDILCNSGGVIVSYFEWVQGLQRLFWSEDEVNNRLRTLMDRAFGNVMHRSAKDGVSHRVAATAIGVERVQAAKRARGLFP